MDETNKELAFIGRPPGEPRTLYQSDLDNMETIGDLFCSCAVGDGLIYREGWRYLVSKHGIDSLLVIDASNWDWFDGDKDVLIDNAKIGGYDPDSDQFGVFNSRTGEFVPSQRAT